MQENILLVYSRFVNMSLFRKPKEEIEDTTISGRTVVAKPTDNQDPPRGKKKEPPKPWGRKERLVVLVILLATVGSSAILALSARNWKLPGTPRFKMPSINFFEGKTIIIEGENKKDYFMTKESVKNVFIDETRKLSGLWGLYIVDLESGDSWGVNQNEVFTAASLIKLPVMITFFQEAEKGNIGLDDEYTLVNSDKVQGAGSLYSKAAGTKVSYRELINYMGKQSDNTAFKASRRILSDEKIKETIDEMGMIDTSLEENKTTPEDIGRLFNKLWNNELISFRHEEEMLEYLTKTNYESWLAGGVGDVRVAHKYGREVHVVNDAGIIYSTAPYILVILSEGVVEKEADIAFPEIVKKIHQLKNSN